MKKAFISVVCLGMVVLGATTCMGDVYMKASGFGMETETWTSKDKQITISQVPMMGPMRVIIRLDKGIQWSINDSQRIYEEKPITVPYTPQATQAATQSINSSYNQPMQYGDQMSSMSPIDENVSYEFKRLGENRQYAGMVCVGYVMIEKGKSTSDTIVWIAEKTRDLKGMEKEMSDFNKELIKMQFSNFPKEEREKMMEGVKGMQQLFMKAFSSEDGKLAGFPDGMLMAMEGRMSQETGMVPFFEIRELREEKIGKTQFEIPSGYKKVADMSEAMANQMMGGSGLQGLASMLRTKNDMAPNNTTNAMQAMPAKALPAESGGEIPKAVPVYSGKAVPVASNNPMSALFQAFSGKEKQAQVAKPARAIYDE